MCIKVCYAIISSHQFSEITIGMSCIFMETALYGAGCKQVLQFASRVSGIAAAARVGIAVKLSVQDMVLSFRTGLCFSVNRHNSSGQWPPHRHNIRSAWAVKKSNLLLLERCLLANKLQLSVIKGCRHFKRRRPLESLCVCVLPNIARR